MRLLWWTQLTFDAFLILSVVWMWLRYRRVAMEFRAKEPLREFLASAEARVVELERKMDDCRKKMLHQLGALSEIARDAKSLLDRARTQVNVFPPSKEEKELLHSRQEPTSKREQALSTTRSVAPQSPSTFLPDLKTLLRDQLT